jgi:uncharacterized protein YerC
LTEKVFTDILHLIKLKMRISKNKLNSYLEQEILKTLHQLIVDLKSPTEVDAFLDSFLGKTEHMLLAKRVAVAYWLSKGRGYQNIKDNLKVSSATIATVHQKMKESSKGIKLALQKIAAEEWANLWSQRIQRFVKGR